jgi:hypothetical protein
MSMIHQDPVPNANARAKSMIDAVTGHQPSPLDSEHSSERPATPSEKMGKKNAKSRRVENEQPLP